MNDRSNGRRGSSTRGGQRSLYAPERQQALLLLARSEGRVSVVEAAQTFNVTPETIRRDLEALDRAGMVRRVHGGAVPAEHLVLGDLSLTERESTAAAEKGRIGIAALPYLPTSDNSAIVVDAGSTTGRFVEAWPIEVDLTVFTNSPNIANSASMRTRAEVQLSGGRLRGVTQACVGARTVDWFRKLRVDVAFVGINGLSFDHGLSTPDVSEADVKAEMVRSARRVVVLTDSRKLGVETAQSFCTIDDIDVVITDTGISDALRRRLEERGIEVVVA